jgi:hypothetical protein
MIRRRRNMRRIGRGLSWKRHALDEGRGQAGDSIRHVQRRYARQKSGPRRSRPRIPSLGLVDHHLRHVQVECRPSRSPLCVSTLLAGRHDQIAAGTPREIAEDARFDVNGVAHPLILRPAAQLVTAPFPDCRRFLIRPTSGISRGARPFARAVGCMRS